MLTLEATMEDKLSLMPDATKQLVHYIGRGFSDQVCVQELASRKKFLPKNVSIQSIILDIADQLSIPAGTYEERRLELVVLSKRFFGLGAVPQSSLPAMDESLLPPLESVIASIEALAPLERIRLEAAVRAETEDEYAAEGKRLRITAATLRSTITMLNEKLGFVALSRRGYLKSRKEHLRRAFEEMRHMQPGH